MCKCQSYNFWSRSETRRIKGTMLASGGDGFPSAAQESRLMLIVPAFLISLSPSENEKRALITVLWMKRRPQIHIGDL